jgi:hypothetical protein
MNNPATHTTTSIPITVLYGVAAVLLISGVYLLVTATSPACGLINIILGGTLIASDVSRMNQTNQQGGR